MTTTNSVSNPFASLGLAAPASATTGGATGGGPQTLDMNSFMKLLTTQLQNQDPTNPTDNSQMVAQLAQFSSLQGINQLNTTVSGFQSSIQSNQIMQAASLVGKAAIVKGSAAYVSTGTSSTGTPQSSGILGAVDVPTGATNLAVTITNSSGQVVNTQTVPITGSTQPNFAWNGLMPDGSTAPAGTYQVSASATVSGKGVAAQTYVGAVIDSVGVSATGPQLNLAGGLPSAQLSDVVQILN
jgi:flagellar basal-body rod modification protein FlgD